MTFRAELTITPLARRRARRMLVVGGATYGLGVAVGLVPIIVGSTGPMPVVSPSFTLSLVMWQGYGALGQRLVLDPRGLELRGGYAHLVPWASIEKLEKVRSGWCVVHAPLPPVRHRWALDRWALGRFAKPRTRTPLGSFVDDPREGPLGEALAVFRPDLTDYTELTPTRWAPRGSNPEPMD